MVDLPGEIQINELLGIGFEQQKYHRLSYTTVENLTLVTIPWRSLGLYTEFRFGDFCLPLQVPFMFSMCRTLLYVGKIHFITLFDFSKTSDFDRPIVQTSSVS